MPGTLLAPLTGILGPLGTLRGAAAAVGVTDSFNRANNASSLGTADTGQVWTAYSGTWGITGNQAYRSVDAGFNSAALDSGLSDCIVGVRMAAFGTADPNFQGIVCRLTDDLNYLRLLFAPTAWLCYGREAGSFVTYTSGGWPGGSLAAGDLVEVRLEGDQVTFYKNGVSAGSGTVAFNQTATKHGLHCFYDGARWDDFSVSPL